LSSINPAIVAVARKLDIPESGVLFVLDVLVTASEIKFKATGQSQPLDCDLICTAFDQYARDYFNDPDEAIELLDEWGISTSDSVGDVVQAIAALGQMQLSPGVTPESLGDQFVGRFDARTLFQHE
jgi:hypothetical protein